MPPPPKKILPNKAEAGGEVAPSGPPSRSLPKTERVKLIRDSYAGGYMVVTAQMGLIVGPRLWKGRGLYPECATSALQTLDEARLSLAAWDKFLLEQTVTKKK